MTGQNGHAQNGHDLDLSAFAERLSIKIEGAEFTVPADLPLPLLKDATRVLKRLSEVMDGKGDIDQVSADLFAVADAMLERAEPHPGAASEILSAGAAITFVGFLARRPNDLADRTGAFSRTPAGSPPPSEGA
jgi:hypothetical protein